MGKVKRVVLKPLDDRLIIRPLEANGELLSSGIFIPASVVEKKHEGVVVALGTGVVDKPFKVAVGDRVMYGVYSGTEMKYNGVKVLMMRESDIHAIVEEEEVDEDTTEVETK